MRWPWRKQEESPPDLPSADPAAAKAALRRAEQDRAHSQSQWPTIGWLSASLQRHRDENHFAELFIRAMERRED